MSANYIYKYAETVKCATQPVIHSLHLQCWGCITWNRDQVYWLNKEVEAKQKKA